MPLALGSTFSYTVEVAFVADPYGTLTWTDVTSRVEGFSCDRGRNFELGRTEPGTLTVTLDNDDGHLDPMNTGSPYYPYVLPYRPIRVRAVYDTVPYDVWRGFVTSWPQQWAASGDRGQVTVTAVDAMRTALAYVLGPRYDDLQAASTLDLLWHANLASGGTEANAGTAGGNFTISNLTGVTYQETSAIAGTSGYAFGLGATTVVIPPGLWGSNAAGVSIWVKVDSILTDSSVGVIAAARNTTANVNGMRLYIQYGASVGAARFKLVLQNGVPGTTVTLTSTSAPVAGQWHHLAFTQFTTVGGTGTAALYVDGAVEATASGLTNPTGSSGSDLTLGADKPAGTLGNYLLGGHLDEFEMTAANDTAALFTASEILSRYLVGTTAREAPEQLSGARVIAILDMIDWPAGDRSIDTGLSTLPATGSLSGTTALNVLQDAADAELGNVFINGAGTVVFQDRATRNSPTSVATFGDGTGETPYLGNLQIGYDDTYIYNDIQVTQNGSSPTVVKEAIDETSRTTYGLRVLQRSIDAADVDDVQGQADTLLAWYKDPLPRVPQVSMEGVSTPVCLPQMLGREIGDLVTVKRRPPAAPEISIDCFIDGISHDVVGVDSWRTTFMLTPKLADASY